METLYQRFKRINDENNICINKMKEILQTLQIENKRLRNKIKTLEIKNKLMKDDTVALLNGNQMQII